VQEIKDFLTRFYPLKALFYKILNIIEIY